MTPQTIAQWMLDELNRTKILHQDVVVSTILSQFGGEFCYFNDGGNHVIDRRVLNAFRALTGEQVVWVRGENCWRFRQAGDPSGRQAEG